MEDKPLLARSVVEALPDAPEVYEVLHAEIVGSVADDDGNSAAAGPAPQPLFSAPDVSVENGCGGTTGADGVGDSSSDADVPSAREIMRGAFGSLALKRPAGVAAARPSAPDGGAEQRVELLEDTVSRSRDSWRAPLKYLAADIAPGADKPTVCDPLDPLSPLTPDALRATSPIKPCCGCSRAAPDAQEPLVRTESNAICP